MKTYNSYKDSGINWIGEIPEHWISKKLKLVSYIKGRIGWQNLRASEFTTEGPYLITGMNFKGGRIRWNEVYHISEERYDEAPEIQLKVGDVLMTKDGTIGKLLYIDYLPDKASLNSHLLVFRPFSDEYFPKYLYYQLDSDAFKNHIELTKTGTTFYGITQEAVGDYKMILPPLSEQEVITNFLDEKTSKIDSLIAKKQQLIQLLEEEKTAVINEAVTKGLNPDAPMKDSGINWLGSVPAHWKVKKLKYLVALIKDKGIAGKYSNKVALENIESSTGKLLDVDLSFDFNGEGYLFKQGDVLFSKLRPYLAKTHLAEKEGIAAGEILVFRPNDLIKSNFLFYRILSSDFIKEVDSSTYGSKMPRAGWNFIEQLLIPYPSKDEQELIASHITSELERINNIKDKTSREISLLQEYRKALISEAVTGKIDVREYQPEHNKQPELV